jgi:putative mRNA 3-end processing factor
MSKPLIQFTPKGMYCAEGDFYIDPWRPVPKALITHGHADHARHGHQHYVSQHITAAIMQHRIHRDLPVHGLAYGESLNIRGVRVSFHPAGHIPGSAQIRLEHKGQVWVAAGDYKTASDAISTPFETVKCHTFITESTFGLPVFRWRDDAFSFAAIQSWWAQNAEQGIASVLFGYSLGKAQRLLMGLGTDGPGAVFLHPAVAELTELVQAQTGLQFPAWKRVEGASKLPEYRTALIIAPPAVDDSSWIKKFQPYKVAMASGWMAIRGMRRRRNPDLGVVLSDHADFPGIMHAIRESGAERVVVTHGYSHLMAKYLIAQGYDALAENTEFNDEWNEDTP